MTRQTDITTERDPHRRLHRLLRMGLVWLTADLKRPRFARTSLATILTVPPITYLIVPTAKSLISRADRKA